MRKFLNMPAELVADGLRGFAAAHSERVVYHEQAGFLRRATPAQGKVALISGGGSGHEPLHIGFVGPGLLDAACPGRIFSSPSPAAILAAAQAVAGPEGVLFIVKNYDGDRMNFQMAAELFPGPCAVLLVGDDVSTDQRQTTAHGRRGLAGTLVFHKILGAAAEAGLPLPALHALGQELAGRLHSMGTALSACVAPAVTRPSFSLDEGQMEVGVGIHGEPGLARHTLVPAREIAGLMVRHIVNDIGPDQRDDPLLLLINGLGATPLIELYLMFGEVAQHLTQQGFTIRRQLVGSFVTSLDMAGCSVTVGRMTPDLLRWWDAPATAPHWPAASPFC